MDLIGLGHPYLWPMDTLYLYQYLNLIEIIWVKSLAIFTPWSTPGYISWSCCDDFLANIDNQAGLNVKNVQKIHKWQGRWVLWMRASRCSPLTATCARSNILLKSWFSEFVVSIGQTRGWSSIASTSLSSLSIGRFEKQLSSFSSSSSWSSSSWSWSSWSSPFLSSVSLSDLATWYFFREWAGLLPSPHCCA